MARISLSSVINSSFLNRFAGVAGETKLSGSFSSGLQGTGASNTDLSSALRLGARTYATAIQGLNSAISVINLSESTLKELGKIADKLIDVTTRATRSGASNGSRAESDRQYRKLATEFQKVVSDSQLGNISYLTTDGLADLFSRVGLDKTQSESIADIFTKFVTPKEDSTLASESEKGQRPVPVPPQAFSLPLSDASYIKEKLTNQAITNGGVTTVNAVYADTDSFLNQNPSYQAVFDVDAAGNVTTQKSGQLTANLQTRGLNDTTGYSIVQSTGNYLGFNAGGFNQLFVVNSSGTIVHQLTNNASATRSFNLADAADNNLTYVVSSFQSSTGNYQIATIAVGTLGEDPALSTTTVYENTTTLLQNPKISNNGAYIAYQKGASGSEKIQLYDTATRTVDAWLAADTQAAPVFGFSDSNELLLARKTGVGNLSDIKKYVDGASAFTTVLTNITAGKFAALQSSGSETLGSFILEDTAARTITAYYENGTSQVSYTMGASDNVTQLTAAYDSRGKQSYGIDAVLPSFNNDSDEELYRFSKNPASTAREPQSKSSEEYDTIFDSERDIRTRPNAYRVLADLKALKKQINDNLGALDNARKAVLENVSLVRATGNAFLELSNSVKSDADADQIASELRDRIRKNAGSALSQAENLEAIAVAALTLDTDKLK